MSLSPGAIRSSLFLTERSTPSCCYWFKYQNCNLGAWLEELIQVKDCLEDLKAPNASLNQFRSESGSVEVAHRWLGYHFDRQHFAICLTEAYGDKTRINTLVAAPFDQVKANIKKKLISLPEPLKFFFASILDLSTAQCQLLVYGISLKDPNFFGCMLEFFPEQGRITETETPLGKKLMLRPQQPLMPPRIPKSALVDLSRFISEVPKWLGRLQLVSSAFPPGSDEAKAAAKDKEIFRTKKGAWIEDRSSRAQFLPALTAIVSNIFQEHAHREGSILELGAYLLNKDGRSVLSEMAPKETEKRWIYSDVIKAVVKDALNNSERLKHNAEYVHVDALEFIPCKKRNIRTIVSLNVCDTFESEEVDRVAKNLFDSLPKGGRVIVLTEYLPFLDPRLNELMRQGLFVSLKMDSAGRHLLPQAIIGAPREIIEAKIRQAIPSMPSELGKFWTGFLALGSTGRRFLIKLFSVKPDGFFDCLNQFFPKEGITSVDPQQQYFRNMTETLVRSGFEVRLSGKQTKVMEMPSKDGSLITEMTYDMGLSSFKQRTSQPAIPITERKITANMHVIVAVKP